MANLRANATPEKKKLEKATDQERKANIRKSKVDAEKEAFQGIENKVHHSVLHSQAFELINQKCKNAFSHGAEFICDICDQLCFKRNTRIFNPENYEKDEKLLEELLELIRRTIHYTKMLNMMKVGKRHCNKNIWNYGV